VTRWNPEKEKETLPSESVVSPLLVWFPKQKGVTGSDLRAICRFKAAAAKKMFYLFSSHKEASI
jgi:hypothetical protein